VTLTRRSAMMNSVKSFATGALKALRPIVNGQTALNNAARALPSVQSKGLYVFQVIFIANFAEISHRRLPTRHLHAFCTPVADGSPSH